ncbi:MAG TPA: InlB B-repeat-containing protein [Candidatus Gallimonas gallistercoris]|uniref:InlB B-repeat-containing protein n=1 Tax=Candidatus Gallimonas gallistercoris TaxID=2838602 RepID=A0A9D2H1U6_9FIRM|nr:InlB B-repeat-containing protein [Candidatus Gallimonas gallistercoris]
MTVNEKEGVLGVAVKGNELLRLLGIDLGTFEVGDISLHVSEGEVRVEALGANVVLSEGETPRFDGNEYIDILPYAKTLINIFSSHFFRAEIDVEVGSLAVSGTVSFELDPVAFRAQLLLSAGGAPKLVTVEYAENDLFLTIDGVRLKADADELLKLLSSSLSLDREEDEEAVDYLKNFLSLDFSKVVHELSEEDGALYALVNGNEIMRALGIRELTGYIEVQVDEDSISLSCAAYRVALTLSAGDPFYIDRTDHIDVGPMLEKLFDMAEAKAFSFDGSLSLEAGGVQLSVNILRGTLSWENGFSAVVEGEIALGGGWQRFYLSANSSSIRIALGDLGISLAYDEFSDLGELASRLMEELAPAAERLNITLPDLSSVTGLLENFQAISGGLDLSSVDLGQLLGGLTLKKVPGSLFGVEIGALSLTLTEERSDIASVGIGYSGEGFTLDAALTIDESRGSISMPRVPYLGVEEIEELSGYLTSAARLLGEDCIKAQLTFDGITLDIWLDNRETSESGGAGVYVSVSRFAGQEGYVPLELWASAEEFKSILASAGALLGVELPVMGDSLDQDIAARLQVIGESLFTTLRSELGDLLGGSGSVSKELISDFSMNEDGVSLTLGGGALGLGSDLSLFLNKPAEGTASLAGGIATGGTQIGFSLTGDTMPALPEQSAENALVGKYEVTGIGALLSSLAKTATHKATEEEFVGGTAESADDILLNRTFFIDGSIEVDAALDLGLFEIPIKDYEIALQALSVSIHEDGEISLNVRLQYDDLKFVVDLIHGSTLDLTFKGDMIYMRRVSGGETLYRAMPLSVFGETIMEQLVFMFNMSDTVANMLSDISPEENGSEEAGDLGAQAGNILSGYEYLEESGKWVLTFNGGALTGNVLGDIEVTLGTDENGCISSLGVIAGMEKSLFKVDLSADLTLKNAGENFANVGEYTDLSAELSEGMGAAIEENNENGWTSHLEAAKSTVSFVVDGETVETQDVFVSGDKVLSELSYPDLEEREGYTASGWTQNGLTYTAKYVPNVYFLHFESDRAVEGWSQENGKWTFTLEYAYGTQGFELPFAKDLEQYIAYFTDEAGVRYRSAEDLLTVLSDKTLTAVWEEREYTVTYTDGDTVLGSEVLHYGDALTFPQAPEKEGYRFVGWDTAESTVTGDMTIEALYEPLSFTVTIVSSLPYEGFVEAENCYLYTCEYTYGSSAIQLDDLSDVSGYWFGGFYTRPDGKGNQVNAVEGILADTTYYVYWQDNTVRVRLYSDLELEGAQKDEEGYFIEKTFNDTYALSDAPAIEGYRQLGWWVESDGGWKPVDDVLEFYGQDDVRIWAVWMQEIEIGISDFSVNVTDILVSKVVTYNIHGTVEGGKIVGAHGSQIFPSEPTKEVNYLVYGNGKQDVLSGGEAEAIEEGAFGKSKMTCGNFGSTMNTAPYGGAKVTHIFTYLDADGTTQSVSTTDEATISLESYTIVYRDEDGAEVMRMEVRGSYGAKLTLAEIGLPEVPEKIGYEGSWDKEGEYVIDSGDRQYAASSGGGLRPWPDLVLSHTIEVRPVYTAKLYPVTLTAQDDVQIDGWTGDSYTLELHFGDVIRFEQSGNSLGSYTVGTENEVLLPKLASGAYWCAIEETEQGILIRAMKDPDHVTLYDAFGGESEVSFDTVYTPDAPSPQDGFTFLGWWKQTDGAWEKVDSLAYTGGGNQFALYALWVKLGNVSANSDNKTLTVTADAPQFKSAHEGLSASGTIKVSYRVKYASGLFGWGSTETEGTLTIVGQEASQTFDGKIKEYSLTGKTLIYTVDGETYELQF